MRRLRPHCLATTLVTALLGLPALTGCNGGDDSPPTGETGSVEAETYFDDDEIAQIVGACRTAEPELSDEDCEVMTRSVGLRAAHYECTVDEAEVLVVALVEGRQDEALAGLDCVEDG